jgi:hypothetical protein
MGHQPLADDRLPPFAERGAQAGTDPAEHRVGELEDAAALRGAGRDLDMEERGGGAAETRGEVADAGLWT